MKIAINGLGRVGRCLFRSLYERDQQAITAINCTMSPEVCAHFIRWDSTHGRFAHEVTHGVDWIAVDDGQRIKIINERDPANIKWGAMGVDIVAECSGFFNKRSEANIHLSSGAKKVLISAPSDNPDKTIICGVNHTTLKAEDQIVSAGSCTSNCIAPVVHALHKAFGLVSGFFVTVHAYTNDQNILDANHSDLRRARAGTLSMIPTTTGASKIIDGLFPKLAGRIKGTAIRVPVPNVSAIDFSFCTASPMEIEYLHNCFTGYDPIMTCCDEQLVSIDFLGNTSSAIIDLNEIILINDYQARILAWYDNEWAFACRMCDLLAAMSQ